MFKRIYIKILLTCFSVSFLFLSCASADNVYSESSAGADISNEDKTGQIDFTENMSAFADLPQEPEMFPYEGQILNIFFHCLVARPEIAFTGRMKDHFLDWYVTAEEYRKILYELYINDYVLVDIKEIYEIINNNGNIRVIYRRPLVPLGKKPMILSVDDLNYYRHVRANGCVHKLVIDDNGAIAAWTDNGNGGELSYDLDVVTYLEEFIKKYPDFSIRGAKGIIALTGFQGILGYNTHQINAPGYLEEVKKAIAVVNRLKELNWHFASHSWGHIDIADKPISSLVNDQRLWDQQVKHILGETDLFIYPYGAGVENQEEKHRFLRGSGFRVFFGVGSGFGHSERNGYLYFTRRNIDGVYFRAFRNRPDKLFDFDKVVDMEMRNIR